MNNSDSKQQTAANSSSSLLVVLAQRAVDSHWLTNGIIAIILLAGIVVGLETYPTLMEDYGHWLELVDSLILYLFVLELFIRFVATGAHPIRFFKDGWNIFDFVIIFVCFLPLAGEYALVLRLARVLRVLKLIENLPKLQVLVSALVTSIPSLGYITMLLGVHFYVYAVLGTFLFHENDPFNFGDLTTSLTTLFGVVTLEGWIELLHIQMYGCDQFGYDGIEYLCAKPEGKPIVSIIYFVSFILVGSMIILNLFIGVILQSMEEAHVEVSDEKRRKAAAEGEGPNLDAILIQMDALKKELVDLKSAQENQQQE